MSTSSPLTTNDSPITHAPGSLVAVMVPAPMPTPLTYGVSERQSVCDGAIVRVPLGKRLVLGTVWGASTDQVNPARLKWIDSVVDAPPLRPPLRAFLDWVADWTLAAPGMVTRMVTRGEELMQRDPPVTAVRLAGERPARMTPARAQVLDVMKAGEAYTKSGLADIANVSTAVIDGLVKAGTLEQIKLAREPGRIEPDPDFNPRPLSQGQMHAVEALRQEAPKDGSLDVALLEGVTGSGKTEVYFEAIAQALKQGRQALILLPEIALTAGLLDRFSERFGAMPGEWHSAITPKTRRQTWRGVAEGKVKVVVGARSALYLPFADLGMIIIDEEHEAAYKQEEWVSYNARDMAIVRARFEKAQVILASATPSVESRINASSGRYRHIQLGTRYAARPLPSLAAIDLRRTPPERGTWLAPPLIEALQDTLDRGEQSLLFLNRRGYAPLTLCRSCGHRFECALCSAWLVQHRFTHTLNCHHCGHVEPMPTACPECGNSDSLVPSGPGVERIAEEVETRFPEARSLVLSSDMAGGPKRLKAELAAIADGQVDIVVGTQLVAKGHNFPGLTLVGVVDADVGFGQGDPRAVERTFQLLTQVTGRAGRADKPGIGLIQTHMPDHPVLQALLAHDTERFYALEAQARQNAHLPPFVRFVAVIVSGSEPAKVKTHAGHLKRIASPPEDIDVLGPVDAPLAMLRGRFRQRLLVRGPRGRQTQNFVKDWLARADRTRGDLRIDVDVDPQSFV